MGMIIRPTRFSRVVARQNIPPRIPVINGPSLEEIQKALALKTLVGFQSQPHKDIIFSCETSYVEGTPIRRRADGSVFVILSTELTVSFIPKYAVHLYLNHQGMVDEWSPCDLPW